MRANLSDREVHELYCPVRNVKSALFLVVSFFVIAFASWRGLHKSTETPDVVLSIFAMIVVAMLTKWLFSFTCFRERLVLVFGIVSLLAGQAQKFAPSLLGKYTEAIKTGKFALAVLGLVVSLTMLVQSSRNRNKSREPAPHPL